MSGWRGMSVRDLSPVIWRKSSRSNANGGQCVEVGRTGSDSLVRVRDSKDPGPILVFAWTDWDAFLEGVRRGRLAEPAGRP
ncbi:DUF397 domain-containing protein [Sphaerisporangium sp. NPDC049003]|uniref:DUF397 domain-containing protein n=1 Tax=Sphaerisporangium sp. NPDC049003 TaxID=3364517 RepID=UPI0037122141